jgi:methylenetetrahydrofolate--tRNA-(uracil-5-)-methyltransferase
VSGTLTIIGGGLAGCEAAWQAAQRGLDVELYEMRPSTGTEAHTGGGLAELVCSNSLKSEAPGSAPQQLKAELKALGSLALSAAEASRVPAGLNLSVDRARFSAAIEAALQGTGRVRLRRQRLDSLPAARPLIVASGPLTHAGLAQELGRLLGQGQLYFYDAIAPIVMAHSIDLGHAFAASRWGKGEPDYLNCPLDQAQYAAFIAALRGAERVPFHGQEQARHFEGCMPIEDLADRGDETLRFGPMKPVGLIDPATGRRPYACVQLRKETAAGDNYNLVGFQTRMKYGEQARVLRLIPGLAQAEFARFGSLHRNTFINAPALLGLGGQARGLPGVFFAGQVTGVEGYLESAASGLMAGINAARLLSGRPLLAPPRNSMMGSLAHYLAQADPRHFQPINANWGLVEPMGATAAPGAKPSKPGKQERALAYAERGRAEFQAWLQQEGAM